MYMGLGATQQQAAATVGSSLLASAGAVGKVNPIAGGILAVAGSIADIVSLFGPNPDNTITTGYVNQIEADIMKPNLAAWDALAPTDQTYTNQTAAEANFNTGWNEVLQLCDPPALGSAGTDCIADRERGGKWDWFSYYYTPIADSPNPAINAAAASNPLSSVTSLIGGGSSWIPLALIAGVAFMVADS